MPMLIRVSVFVIFLIGYSFAKASPLPNPSDKNKLKNLIKIEKTDRDEKLIVFEINNNEINRFFSSGCLVDISVGISYLSNKNDEFIKNSFVSNYQYKMPTTDTKTIQVVSLDVQSPLELSIGLLPSTEDCDVLDVPRTWYFEFLNYEEFFLFAEKFWE